MRKKIAAINAGAVTILKHTAGMLQWKENEQKDVDRKPRKTMSMYVALHSKRNWGRFLIKRKERSRGLMSVERCTNPLTTKS